MTAVSPVQFGHHLGTARRANPRLGGLLFLDRYSHLVSWQHRGGWLLLHLDNEPIFDELSGDVRVDLKDLALSDIAVMMEAVQCSDVHLKLSGETGGPKTARTVSEEVSPTRLSPTPVRSRP